MTTRSNSGMTVLMVILLVLTFPVWIGLLGASIGIIAGVFGATFGVVAGVFGAIFGAIAALVGVVIGIVTWPFRLIFGGHWGIWHNGFNGYLFCAIIIVVFLLTQRGAKRT